MNGRKCNSAYWDTSEDRLQNILKMYKSVILILALAATALTAELSSSYASLEKNAAFQPDLKTESIETHAVFKKANSLEKHPVYRAEDRARIEPVRPSMSSQMKHDMLSDQPALPATDLNRADNQPEPQYGFITRPVEVAYPDVPYAPGYGYDNGYAASNYYDMYGNPNNYMMEPDTSAFSLLWSQVPDARTLVSYAGRTISWVFSSIFVILLGSFLTIGVCSYTNLCSITFHGVGPIHEEMRSLMSPERLEKISHAADFVKNAIDKYQKINQVTESNVNRNRRAIFY